MQSSAPCVQASSHAAQGRRGHGEHQRLRRRHAGREGAGESISLTGQFAAVDEILTQYLDEAEQLADRIAILHEGRITVNGTLAELKQLLPPAEVTYVEKQPTLEDVFLALVGTSKER